METIIDFENIYVNYGLEFQALKNINLKIKAGENWAILGANGSGKSTLIKLFSNDLYPSTKYPFKKEILGEENRTIFELKKHIGIITNDLHNIYSNYGKYSSAYEVILSGFHSSIQIYEYQTYTEAQHEKAMEVLKFLEIEDIKNKKVQEMSTGQLRRCIIGRALIHEPKVFILDEPTVGLDIKAQNSFIKVIQKLSQKTSIILVTHHLEEIFEEISHVALIHNNGIYMQGKKEEILNSKNLSEVFEIKIDLQKEKNRYYIKSIE